MTQEPHPFARFIKILGRGRTLSRSLSLEEAEEAMGMVLRGEVLPEQLGAFLMLLRVKEESPEEIAGFVRAARALLPAPPGDFKVDVDWSSYAGKKRQLPWFLLSALLLARNGWRVFMHGMENHTAGRLYTSAALAELGLPVASSFEEAAAQLRAANFSYLPLEALSPEVARLFGLRPIFGLRSPAHTFARMINPFGASCMLMGIFHPGYMAIHQGAAVHLGQPHMAVFRGEGGEIERRPNKPCEVQSVHDGVLGSETWPPIVPEPHQGADVEMDLDRLGALWRGDIEDDYARAAVTGTLAIALAALGAASGSDDAQAKAEAMWQARDRGNLLKAA